MSIQIFPESVETLECVICYDSCVELNEVCHNKHKLCKICITRIKNKKCPFCRTNIDYDVGDIESQEQQQEQQQEQRNDDRHIEVVVPEHIQQQTRGCICITKIIQVVSLITIFIIFVVNYDTYSQTEIALFIITIMLFSFSLFFSTCYRIRIL